MSRRAYAKLTPREEQRIVALRAEGLTFDVIAVRVGCSKGTVWNTLNAHAQAAAQVASGCRIAVEDNTGECTDAIGKVRALIKKTAGRLP